MADFVVFEQELSTAAGVPRSAFVKKRRELLTDGVDYSLVKNALAYTQDGALRLLVGFGVGSPETVLESAVLGLPEDKKTRAVGVVWKLFRPNTSVLVCTLEKSGEKVTVRVKHNGLFEIGQRIPLKKTADGCVWLLDAPAPRRRGVPYDC